MKLSLLSRSIAAAGLLAACLAAGAVPVAPGSVVPLAGTTEAARPELAGVVLADVSRNFTLVLPGVNLDGTLQDRVVRSDLDGTLDFYTRITALGATITDADRKPADIGISGFGRASFEGFATDMDWRIDGLPVANGVAPLAATRSDPGSTAGFYFGPLFNGQALAGVTPGRESPFALVKTDATAFDANGTMNLFWWDGTQYHYAQLAGVFQPSAVPEPGTWALLLAGLAVLPLRRRR